MVNVQKHKLLLSLLFFTMTGIFTACTNDTETLGIHNGTPLAINVGVDTQLSRAVITGNSLPDGSQIGVTVVDESGTDYQEQDYNNVCYQAVNKGGSQKWQVQSRGDILLSGEAGTLYAYYPWSSAVTNIKQMAVNMDEEDQKDWMVAQPVTNLSDAQATASVKMQHMLTNFKLSFYKDNYSGNGQVTEVTIRSNAFATTGTLDATTGTFTAYGDVHTLTRAFTTTLGTDKAAAAPCNVMVVPNTVAAPVTVSVTVDGNTYSPAPASLTLEKAKSYNYAMKLSSTGLDITEVTVTDWQTQDLGETDFEPVIPSIIKVYAMSATGELIDYNTADATAKGVVLHATGKNFDKKFMIAKSDATNDGSNRKLYWGYNLYRKDVAGITEFNKAPGYLGGSRTPQLSTDFTTWTEGVLSDFNGKANTAAIIAAYSQHSVEMNAKDMCKVLETFNAGSDNQGHTDWYIPAEGQLALMHLAKDDINAALAKIGGAAFASGYYWSSSEYSSGYAWLVNFDNGSVDYDFAKNEVYCVRFVRDIN